MTRRITAAEYRRRYERECAIYAREYGPSSRVAHTGSPFGSVTYDSSRLLEWRRYAACYADLGRSLIAMTPEGGWRPFSPDDVAA